MNREIKILQQPDGCWLIQWQNLEYGLLEERKETFDEAAEYTRRLMDKFVVVDVTTDR